MLSRALPRLALAAAALVAVGGGASATFSAFSQTAGNQGNTFATASSFGPTCSNTTVAPYYMTGAEHGRISGGGGSGGWDAVTGTMTADSTVARSGSYSVKAAPSGAAAYVYRTFPVSPAEPDAMARFAIRLASLPGSNVSELFKFSAFTNGGSAVLGYDASSQKLTMTLKSSSAGTPSVVSSATAISAGTWYTIDVRYTNGSSPHTAEWRVDGVQQTTASATGTADKLYQAVFGTTVSATYTANYDDVVLSLNGTEYPMGAGKVLALAPDGMGTSVNPSSFQDDDGTVIDSTSWQRVDEIPMTSKLDYVTQVTAGGTSYAELTFANTTETCIRAVWVNFTNHNVSTTGGSNNPKLSLFDGSTEAFSYTTGWTQGTAGPYHFSGRASPASTPWTQSSLNGVVARFGYGTDIAPQPYLDAVVLEYEVQQ
ncbi:MAG TPA: hypothetical protein VGW75_13590 [Solirubrobacteraceae bacterium]|jgi:hypothetical protein|nr:hypothetical protein [Solirubrobacteraceae bacterium]